MARLRWTHWCTISLHLIKYPQCEEYKSFDRSHNYSREGDIVIARRIILEIEEGAIDENSFPTSRASIIDRQRYTIV